MSSPPGARFSIRAVADGAAVQIDLAEPCLNFDVSEPLKQALKEEIARCLGDGHRTFVLDLATVTVIDSCGVGMLIALHHQITGAGGLLAITHVAPFVAKVLRVMRLDRFLTLYPTPEKALKGVLT